MIGTTLGRYRILGPLGKGGMGEVFLAEDPMLARKVAIKVLPREFALDSERRARLLHEARAASALNHPNIITVHDLGESEGMLFIAVELIEGDTLRDWWARSRRAPADALKVGRQAAQALALAHQAGLVHRDLKPENLMIRRDGLLKILDFGLARSVSPDAIGATSTIPGVVMGTAPYMSPEQVLGQPAGPASDVFSLGTILYELLAGKHPFAAESSVETMHRILHESPEPLSRVNPALTVEYDFVLAKALSKDPRRRQSSMSDLDVDLETLEYGAGGGPAARSKSAAGKEGPRTIAVLPFKNIGGDPELSYLGMGLADAVITRLSTSPDLIVRTTSSIFSYENQPVDPRRVAQELDVSSVLDSSFQRIGERFRATARLVEAATGRILWAGKVDLRFEDMFEVQDQVAHGIAEALMARQDAQSGKRTYTPGPVAYEHVLRGLDGMRKANREGCEFAIDQFERAVRAEPDYGRAWAELAFSCNAMVDGGYVGDPQWYSKAQEALARAQALEPDDERTHFVAGALHLVRGRKSEAYRDLTASLVLAPNVSLTYHYLAYLYRLSDMVDESRAADVRSMELEPYAPWSYTTLFRLECYLGQTDRAREWLELMRRKVGGERPDWLEGMLRFQEGKYQEAYEMLKRFAHRELDVSSRVHLVIIMAGHREEAEEVFKRVRLYAEVDMDGAADAAAYLAQAGRVDEAFHYLDRAVQLGNDTLTRYERFPLYEPLHSDPRWKAFLDGVRGRVARWKSEFRWPPLTQDARGGAPILPSAR